MNAYAAITLSPETFLAIITASAVAGAISAVVRFGTIVVPAVVIELVFGIVLGPRVLGLKVDPFVSFFSNLGLGMLFFFAGYEIDLGRIAGAPLRLGLAGWGMSLAIGYALGGALPLPGSCCRCSIRGRHW